ncbi:hypothetical protein CBL_20339 [Carabus blaptoides fortunei]
MKLWKVLARSSHIYNANYAPGTDLHAAVIDMARVPIGPKETNKLKIVPLSIHTISRLINGMATEVHNQIIEKVKSSEYLPFSLTNQQMYRIWLSIYILSDTNAMGQLQIFYFASQYLIMQLDKAF